MPITKAQALESLPNGYRLLALGEEVPVGEVLRMFKSHNIFEGWLDGSWSITQCHITTGLKSWYAVKASQRSEEW